MPEKDRKLKIGIAGCGAIGSSLAKTIVNDFAKDAELVALYDVDAQKSDNLSAKFNRKLGVSSLDDLINKVDLVIEATKAGTAFDIARKALSNRRDIMIMSVGGILEYYQELKALAREKGARVFIPSGAICGIDGIKAAMSSGKVNKVILTTKKPPKAFLGVPYISEHKIQLDSIDKDTVIFEGNALEATKAFPQNINVAATLSLAGIGPEATVVRIVVSPGINRNTHEIEIDSDAGRMVTRSENVIHPDNPKTSYLAVLSAVAALKQILEPVKIGT